jgi:transposase
MSAKAIEAYTGIHWATVRKVELDAMKEIMCHREEELQQRGYKPRIFAVDEFAIHKGHKYATCVMDLEEGDVLGVGKGRAIQTYSSLFLENLKAINLRGCGGWPPYMFRCYYRTIQI